MKEDRFFNINNQYLKVLINKKDRIKLADKMNLTVNALNLKLKGSTLLYIDEGITIAKHLKMDILDIFCPTKDLLVKYLVGGDINIIKKTKVKYGVFFINTEHIKEIMKNKEINYEQIQYIWNLKITSVYDKLRGSTRITLKEGISLSFLLNESISKIFCPNIGDILQSNISDDDILGLNTLVNSSTEIDVSNIDMKSLESINFEDRVFNLHLFNRISKKNNITIKDIASLWGVSSNQARNKINKRTITLNQGLKLAQLLHLKFEDLFPIIDGNKSSIFTIGRKLNEEKVRTIRKRLNDDHDTSYEALAEEYNVKPITIKKIHEFKSWKHVK